MASCLENHRSQWERFTPNASCSWSIVMSVVPCRLSQQVEQSTLWLLFMIIPDVAMSTSWNKKVRFLANSRVLKRHSPVSVVTKSQGWEQIMVENTHPLNFKKTWKHKVSTMRWLYPHLSKMVLLKEKNRTLIEAVRGILSQARLAKM